MSQAVPELVSEAEQVGQVRSALSQIQTERFSNELQRVRQGAKPTDPSGQPAPGGGGVLSFKERADALDAEEKRIAEEFPELVAKIKPPEAAG